MEIEALSHNLSALTQQNNLSVSELSSKNKEIEVLKQTINEQNMYINEQKVKTGR